MRLQCLKCAGFEQQLYQKWKDHQDWWQVFTETTGGLSYCQEKVLLHVVFVNHIALATVVFHDNLLFVRSYPLIYSF